MSFHMVTIGKTRDETMGAGCGDSGRDVFVEPRTRVGRIIQEEDDGPFVAWLDTVHWAGWEMHSPQSWATASGWFALRGGGNYGTFGAALDAILFHCNKERER